MLSLDILTFMPDRAVTLDAESIDPLTLPKLTEIQLGESVVVYYGTAHTFVMAGTGNGEADIVMAVEGRLAKVLTPNAEALKAAIPPDITDPVARFEYACRVILAPAYPEIWVYNRTLVHVTRLMS